MSNATLERYDSAVAEEVRAMRARRKVTSKAIAERLGITEMALSRRMNGATPFAIGEQAIDECDVLIVQKAGGLRTGRDNELGLLATIIEHSRKCVYEVDDETDRASRGCRAGGDRRGRFGAGRRCDRPRDDRAGTGGEDRSRLGDASCR